MHSDNVERALVLGGFDGFPANYVFRDHVVKTIDDLFIPGVDVVHLEGRPGIGLTSIAAEYARHSNAYVLSLFIRGGSRLSYAPFRLAANLISQADVYLQQQPTGPQAADVVGEWQTRFTQLQECLRPHGGRILFILDGLHQIPQEDSRFVNEIFRDLLALGVPNVKHLITLGEKKSLGPLDDATRHRPYRISRLSSAEASNIFAHASIPPERWKEYYSYTDGIPVLLQSACRLHARGQSLAGFTSELSSFLSAEWRQLIESCDVPRESLQKALAFLAFGKGALGLSELCDLCGLLPAELLQEAGRESFFRTTKDSSSIEFVSHSHREFVAERLAGMREWVTTAMIDRLIHEPHSDTSLALLPTFFDETNRVDELIDYLSPENLGRYLDYAKSITAVRARTELGLRRALDDARHVQAYQFSLQTSIIRAMDAPRISAEQMGALAALGDVEQALTHAQQSRTNEERIYLLSILIRELKGGGVPIPGAVEQEVRSILANGSFGGSSRWAYAVAKNLAAAFPDLSFEVVERFSYETDSAREMAVVQLALDEVVRNRPDDKRAPHVLPKVKNAETQEFLIALQTALGTQSAEELERSSRKLPGKVRTQLFRQWARVNRSVKDAYHVIGYALDEFVKDPTYLPTAGDLLDLCTTLASCEDVDKIDDIINRVEGFKGSLLEAGSTVDLIGLDLELAVARALRSTVASGVPFEDIYLRVSYLTDAALRLEGYALLLAALERTSRKAHISDVESLRAAVRGELQPLIQSLLHDTGDHEIVFDPVLPTFVEIDPSLAISVVAQFNTEERRDGGYSLVAESYLQSSRSIDGTVLVSILKAIVDQPTRDEAVVSCLRLGNQKGIARTLLQLSEFIDAIANPVLRATALSLFVGLEFEAGKRVDDLLSKLLRALKDFDRAPSRAREAYLFVQAVAGKDKAEGLRIYQQVETALRSYAGVSEAALIASYLAARTAVLNFAGLIPREAFSDQDLGRLLSAIEAVPSLIMRAELLADLALRAHSVRATSLFDQLCSKHIYPGVAALEVQHPSRAEYLSEVFAPLYAWNQSLALELLRGCPRDSAEFAVSRCIGYLLTGLPPAEPALEIKQGQFSVDYPTARSAVDLLQAVETDSVLAAKVEEICRVLSSKASRNQIPGHQRGQLLQSIRDLIARKLPDKRNISHDGWVLYCSAYVALVEDPSASVWESFITRAGAIPNASDRVYVLGELSKVIPEKHIHLRRTALDQAKDGICSIPSDADRMVRRIGLSDVAAGLERPLAEKFLREALANSMSIKDPDRALAVQKRIVDTAQQFDKALAERLVEKLDDDPGRARAKAELRQDAAARKRKEAVASGEYELIRGAKPEAVNRACFESLAGLNSGRLAAPRLEGLGPLLPHASKFALREVYWAYAWFLRACQTRMQGSDEAHRVLKSLFEVTMLSCELVQRIGASSDPSPLWAPRDGSSLVVGPLDRADAVGYLCRWFQENANEHLLICDPYFALSDVELLKQLHFARPGVRFTILSCKASDAARDLGGTLDSAWDAVCDQPPPEMRLVIVLYDGSKGGPIHDRWVLAEQEGLRIGTSLNSLGLSKISEISSVASPQIPGLLSALSRFVNQEERAIDGKRLKYFVETL